LKVSKQTVAKFWLANGIYNVDKFVGVVVFH